MKAHTILINWHKNIHSVRNINSPIWSLDFFDNEIFATSGSDNKIIVIIINFKKIKVLESFY